ncbi:tRNA/rRNA methyltransferase SpoU [Moraxella macacae 0408225]|uniref:tRNA (cytidine(34)-2'-O)-methyltransferase n=1 Tax=Moraxella macacae 0408225 TaxID=1230338 RepID=L2F689_9GAMM|nr:tRNA (cytidine(34)-2'-O)-methyltransferase [Moraxella macacae]ELA08430.1 tRNA/rRNA methyltransferase SpoU [Moraxella macacae 0408225]
MIHIVLFEPKIPSNTGNIIRLCANTGVMLHLVEPLGFELSDKKLRRAGLDYHEFADLRVYPNWQTCYEALQQANIDRIVALTTKLSQPFYDQDFSGFGNIALVFGSETQGLSDEVRASIGSQNWLRLPMLPTSRSLNLSNSVAIALFEVWRQFGFVGDIQQSVGYENLTPYDPNPHAPK